jgi:23S rRNA (uracil1939-C5)-methyltransferase
MHLEESHQIALKSGWLAAAIAPLGVPVTTVRAADRPLTYRNRANFVAARRGARVVLGSYAPRSHDVAAMDGCLAVHPPLARVAGDVQALLEERRVPIWPKQGGLRYVSMRTNRSGQVLVELIVAQSDVWQAPLLEALLALEAVVGAALTVNASSGNALRVAPPVTRVGAATITERIGPATLQLAVETFFQLNTDVAERMYARAAELAQPAAVIWDLYCGIGGLGLTVAASTTTGPGTAGPAAPAVYGADVSAESVSRARQAAHELGIAADHAVCSLAEGIPPTWPAPDLVLVNPPRRGLDPAVIRDLSARAPPRLIYMSCNPHSFLRDAADLQAGGLRLQHVEAYDMLPQTGHIELLALFVG